MILFRNVSLSRGKSTTNFWVSPFFLRKVTIFIGRETKTYILPTKINRRKLLRSAHLTTIILLEYYNHSTTHNNNTQQQQQQHTATRCRSSTVVNVPVITQRRLYSGVAEPFSWTWSFTRPLHTTGKCPKFSRDLQQC